MKKKLYLFFYFTVIFNISSTKAAAIPINTNGASDNKYSSAEYLSDIKHRLDIEKKKEDVHSALRKRVSLKSKKMVDELLKNDEKTRNEKINKLNDSEKKQLFIQAIINYAPRIIQPLIGSIELNEEDELGNIPLHYAISGGNLKLIRYLLRLGSDYNHQNKEGESPRMLAIDIEREKERTKKDKEGIINYNLINDLIDTEEKLREDILRKKTEEEVYKLTNLPKELSTLISEITV